MSKNASSRVQLASKASGAILHAWDSPAAARLGVSRLCMRLPAVPPKGGSRDCKRNERCDLARDNGYKQAAIPLLATQHACDHWLLVLSECCN